MELKDYRVTEVVDEPGLVGIRYMELKVPMVQTQLQLQRSDKNPLHGVERGTPVVRKMTPSSVFLNPLHGVERV